MIKRKKIVLAAAITVLLCVFFLRFILPSNIDRPVGKSFVVRSFNKNFTFVLKRTSDGKLIPVVSSAVIFYRLIHDRLYAIQQVVYVWDCKDGSIPVSVSPELVGWIVDSRRTIGPLTIQKLRYSIQKESGIRNLKLGSNKEVIDTYGIVPNAGYNPKNPCDG